MWLTIPDVVGVILWFVYLDEPGRYSENNNTKHFSEMVYFYGLIGRPIEAVFTWCTTGNKATLHIYILASRF